jgi:hypothetical protein
MPDSKNDDVRRFIAALSVAGSDEREKMMEELRAQVCIFCGSLDPQCACWRDEEGPPS